MAGKERKGCIGFLASLFDNDGGLKEQMRREEENMRSGMYGVKLSNGRYIIFSRDGRPLYDGIDYRERTVGELPPIDINGFKREREKDKVSEAE